MVITIGSDPIDVSSSLTGRTRFYSIVIDTNVSYMIHKDL